MTMNLLVLLNQRRNLGLGLVLVVLNQDEGRVLIFHGQVLPRLLYYVRKGLGLSNLRQLHEIRYFFLLVFIAVYWLEVDRGVLLHAD